MNSEIFAHGQAPEREMHPAIRNRCGNTYGAQEFRSRNGATKVGLVAG